MTLGNRYFYTNIGEESTGGDVMLGIKCGIDDRVGGWEKYGLFDCYNNFFFPFSFFFWYVFLFGTNVRFSLFSEVGIVGYGMVRFV